MSILTSFYSELAAQEKKQGQRETQAQNGARPATQIFHQQTVGLGYIQAPAAAMFDVTFLDEPVFSHGAGVVSVSDRANYQDPVGYAAVRSWVRDDRGFYLGVILSYAVSINDIGGVPSDIPKVTMVHHLKFYGMAFKPMSHDILTEIQTLTARPVGEGMV